MLFVVDESDVVLINIVGELDPEQLGHLSGKFGIPSIDDIVAMQKKQSEEETRQEPAKDEQIQEENTHD